MDKKQQPKKEMVFNFRVTPEQKQAIISMSNHQKKPASKIIRELLKLEAA